LVTTTLYPVRLSAIDSATWITYERSAEPSSLGGVPTAMKMASARWMAVFRSPVKWSRSALAFLATSASRPGS
jgi:hypothetical protein